MLDVNNIYNKSLGSVRLKNIDIYKINTFI